METSRVSRVEPELPSTCDRTQSFPVDMSSDITAVTAAVDELASRLADSEKLRHDQLSRGHLHDHIEFMEGHVVDVLTECDLTRLEDLHAYVKELRASATRVSAERDALDLKLASVKDSDELSQLEMDVLRCERNLAQLYLKRERIERRGDRSAAEEAKKRLRAVCDALECISCFSLCKEMHTGLGYLAATPSALNVS
ncbi:hypothetical protein PENSPDRAFT_680650 [Peniophora sp. CONT]|nr:hypothetical protein PENSPDRAFT_680650 [Peniophora sp. CONT]